MKHINARRKIVSDKHPKVSLWNCCTFHVLNTLLVRSEVWSFARTARGPQNTNYLLRVAAIADLQTLTHTQRHINASTHVKYYSKLETLPACAQQFGSRFLLCVCCHGRRRCHLLCARHEKQIPHIAHDVDHHQGERDGPVSSRRFIARYQHKSRCNRTMRPFAVARIASHQLPSAAPVCVCVCADSPPSPQSSLSSSNAKRPAVHTEHLRARARPGSDRAAARARMELHQKPEVGV